MDEEGMKTRGRLGYGCVKVRGGILGGAPCEIARTLSRAACATFRVNPRWPYPARALVLAKTAGMATSHEHQLTSSFTEMPTNRFVESAFWNFDAMFVPQQHPAREMQDTFYVKCTSPHLISSPSISHYPLHRNLPLRSCPSPAPLPAP